MMKSAILFCIVFCVLGVIAGQELDCTGRQCLFKSRSLTKQMVEIQAAQVETRRARQVPSFESNPGIGFEGDLGSQDNVRAFSGQGEGGQDKGQQGRERGQENRERGQENGQQGGQNNGRQGFENAQRVQVQE